MFAFAGTMMLMALYNLNAGGVTKPNVLVGMLIWAGGIVELLAAILEFINGNTLFATCTSHVTAAIHWLFAMAHYSGSSRRLTRYFSFA